MQWLREHMGQRVYESLWKPLLVGKFSEYYADVNMAWMWARIHARTTRLGTFVGGFQAFFETLAAAVQQRGATLQLSTAVREIAPNETGGFTLHTPQGALAYDAVLSTTSPRLMTRLTPALPAEYLAQLNALKSMGAVVMVIALTRQSQHAGVLLAQPAQGSRLPLPGAVRAHQLRLARALRRRSSDLLRRLSVARA